MRRSSTALLVVLATGGSADARPFVREAFNDRYPATRGTALDGPDRAVCGLCHTTSYGFDIGGERNAYGLAVQAQFAHHGGPCPSGDAACAVAGVEALDSDGDGSSNLAEIQALTWPGHTNADCPPEAGWLCEPVDDPGADLDGDGLTPAQGDCNDDDPAVSPAAADPCGDGRDQDCDGVDASCTSSAAGVVVPPGFTVELFASGLELPTSMDVGPDGRLYVAEHTGRVRVVDGSGGLPASVSTFAAGLHQPFGLAWGPDDRLYVSLQDGRIVRLEDGDLDGMAEPEETFVSGLCTICIPFNVAGIDFDASGNLYVGYLESDNPTYENSVLRITPGAAISTFATGIRNPTDVAVLLDGKVVGPDNGPETFDELNHLVEGADYGWPEHTGIPPGGSGTEAPLELYPKGRSPVGVTVYEGADLCGYQGDLFQAFFQSYAFEDPLLRGRIHRTKIVDDGGAASVVLSETFASRLETPFDVAFDAQGRLYVDEYWTGQIYRIVPTDLDGNEVLDVCDALFTDGFETGDVSAWSASVP